MFAFFKNQIDRMIKMINRMTEREGQIIIHIVWQKQHHNIRKTPAAKQLLHANVINFESHLFKHACSLMSLEPFKSLSMNLERYTNTLRH